MPIVYSRPLKLSHADTLLYEIYMLRFSAQRLIRQKWEDSEDAWVYLESFLTHFRNLIEFLGKTKKIRPTDLHVTTIWGLLGTAPPDNLAAMHHAGAALHTEYETGVGSISKYLHHCTQHRIADKCWQIDAMNDKLAPLLEQVEKELLSRFGDSYFRPKPAVKFWDAHSASTIAYTPTASVWSGILDPQIKPPPSEKSSDE